MNRSQDTVIDDDEETCPLCIEEFDLSDKNFKPCPCGYQICQFCFNSLKTTYEKSTCPNCRRPYDDATIQYKIPTAEEFKLDQMNKNKKQAAAKRKETEKREVEASSRRNLAGVRVKQQNLVYVIGLEPTKKDEAMLLETLRGKDYFGQYGDIEKIVVSKAKPGATNQGIGVYVTFKRKEDAATCIEAVDGSNNGERILRAQYGTTKYCSAFLRGETCMNKNCSFLHETGEEAHHTSLQNDPSDNKPSSRPSLYSQGSSIFRTGTTPQPGPIAQPMARQSSRDTLDSRKGSNDASALPPTAGWAHTHTPTARVRRSSLITNTPSPQLSHALPSVKTEQPKPAEVVSEQAATSAPPNQPKTIVQPPVTPEPVDEANISNETTKPNETIFDSVKRYVTVDFVSFVYDDSWMSSEERARIADMPPLYDRYGGAKRRLMEDRETAERARVDAETKAKLEAQATSAAEDAMDDEHMAAGSLALGGEPEDDPRSMSSRGAISRPNQSGAGLGDQFTSQRSLTPQQRQQLTMLTATGVQQAPGLPQPPAQNTAFEMSDFERRGPQYSQAQYDQISNHQRHGSRYFNNDSKTTSNRFPGQQQQQQQTFYPSGVQGPPPGLPTAGTPPVSGGGMFAHGQGFTNTGFGTAKDANAELHLRGRSGTNSGHDMSKRELLLSLQNNPLRSPPLQASAPGVLNPLYSQFTGSYQDPGLVKQRKKGKKHRHANTSSSGGGVEHLADPSIIQTRIHQGGATGQGLFGGNQVDTLDFPPLPIRSEARSELHSRVSSLQSSHGPGPRVSTPKIPPGFENTHGHPVVSSHTPAVSVHTSPAKASTTPILPAIPNITQLSAIAKPKASPPKPNQRLDDNSLPSEPPKANESLQPDISRLGISKELISGSTTEAMPTVMPAEQSKAKDDLELHLPEKKIQVTTNRPNKIEIPPSMVTVTAKGLVETPGQLPGANDTRILDSPVNTTPDVLSSRPITPGTAVSEISKASGARPRTLRLTTTMIQQAESARLTSPAATEKSAILPALSQARREHSRQPSISSISRSRPSSPSVSDRIVSQDVSRAGSPPPGGIVGSAPSRIKTKAQAKKDRKEKAKMAEVVESAVDSASVAPTVEEVGPIIARQKKQKKSKSSTTTTEEVSTTVQVIVENRSITKESRKESNKPDTKILTTEKDPKVGLVEPEPRSVSPEKTARSVSSNVAAVPYSLDDLYRDASRKSNSPTTIQGLLSSHVSSMPRLLSEMVAAGHLSRDHPWLANPSLNSAAYKLPPDSRRGQDYLDANGYGTNNAFGYLYIDPKDKRELRSGGFVRDFSTPDRQDDLLNSFLLTPRGCVMRHLTSEESERVQELEYRRLLYEKEFGELGSMTGLGVLEQDDFINLGGGLNELLHNGDKHGVHWVMHENELEHHQAYGNERVNVSYDRMGGDELLVDLADEEIDDDTDEGGEPDLIGSVGHMPGGWDSSFNSAAVELGLTGAPANTLRPIHGSRNMSVNLRTMNSDALHKRIHEKHREVDSSRKDMEKAEKMLTKKGKEFGRWRDALLKA